MTPSAKILVMDEEISKTIYGCYPSQKPQYLGHQDIIQDWFMICAAWRWKGAKKINCVSLLDDPKRYKKNPFDDYHVVKTLRDVVAEADAIAGHNMENFDWKKLLERMAFYKLDPLPEIKIIDTLKMARKIGFSYANLDYLTKRLSLSEKAETTGNKMWMNIVQGKGPEAIKECVAYCKRDIPPAEELLDRLLPYLPARYGINENLFRGDGVDCCPSCGSTNFQKAGFKVTAVGKYPRCNCQDCGRWFQSGKVVKRVLMR